MLAYFGPHILLWNGVSLTALVGVIWTCRNLHLEPYVHIPSLEYWEHTPLVFRAAMLIEVPKRRPSDLMPGSQHTGRNTFT